MLLFFLLSGLRLSADPNRGNDDRFKSDVLLVVAHPDDETAIGSYLARIIFDQHKRVSVVFGNGGGSGGNAQGPEQSRALADIREIEAHKALAHFGVDRVWFLHGIDTPGQDVLRSLENWNHGDQLDRLVRIVRLTRPDVIITWLPEVLMGEDHGDHQAAGVLATEAFDLAGNPASFPEQIAAPRDPSGLNNLLEGLQPWSPKKLYFFSDTVHPQTLEGLGPSYSAEDISPSKHVSYARLATEEASEHLTQGDSGLFAREALTTGKYGYLADKVRFVLGIGCGDIKADIFATLERDCGSVVDRFILPASVELGGPWEFYRHFWEAHQLTHLPVEHGAELMVNFESPVTVPVTVHNRKHTALDVPIQVELPERWIYWRRPPNRVAVAPQSSVTFTFTVRSPSGKEPQTGSIIVQGEGLNPVTLQVEVNRNAMPQ